MYIDLQRAFFFLVDSWIRKVSANTTSASEDFEQSESRRNSAFLVPLGFPGIGFPRMAVLLGRRNATAGTHVADLTSCWMRKEAMVFCQSRIAKDSDRIVDSRKLADLSNKNAWETVFVQCLLDQSPVQWLSIDQRVIHGHRSVGQEEVSLVVETWRPGDQWSKFIRKQANNITGVGKHSLGATVRGAAFFCWTLFRRFRDTIQKPFIRPPFIRVNNWRVGGGEHQMTSLQQMTGGRISVFRWAGSTPHDCPTQQLVLPTES